MTEAALQYFNQAVAAHQSKDLEKAHGFYLACVREDATQPEPWNNMGVILREIGKLPAALACFRRCVNLNPASTLFRMNLGELCAQLGRTEEAKDHLLFVVERDQQAAPAWHTLANIYMSEGEFELGHKAVEHAIRLVPDHIGPRWTKAFGFLMAGDYERGFPGWECRLQLLDQVLPRPSIPVWKKQNLTGKTLLVYGEQGLGDVMQFVRFLKWLPREVGSILFETPIELRSLLERSLARWPEKELVEKFAFRNHGSTLPYSADYQVALLSLPALASVPYRNDFPPPPYLFSLSTRSIPYAKGSRLKVGLCWAGNPTHKFDRDRSSTLLEFFLELSAPEFDLYSLQVGPPNRVDDPTLLGPLGLVRDLAADFKNFSDTADAIDALDVVVTVDTGVAHLAGGMGKETHILLPHHGLDWRWGLSGPVSKWYPNARLHRRAKNDRDWSRALRSVRETLTASVRIK